MNETYGSFHKFGGTNIPKNSNPLEEAQIMADVWARALDETKLVRIVQKRVAVNQVHLLGRVKTEDERSLVRGLINKMLDVTGWEFLHFGKVYMKKSEKLTYGWEFSAGKDDLPSLIRDLCDAVDEYSYDEGYKEPAQGIEVPLIGTQAPEGSVTAGKKGAQPLRA